MPPGQDGGRGHVVSAGDGSVELTGERRWRNAALFVQQRYCRQQNRRPCTDFTQVDSAGEQLQPGMSECKDTGPPVVFSVYVYTPHRFIH